MGHTFGEATELRKQHQTIIEKLKSIQNPIEDLLQQADDLIVKQRPNAEVYTAMAESLGAAWKDLNQLLELRVAILETNYLFRGHMKVSQEIKHNL